MKLLWINWKKASGSIKFRADCAAMGRTATLCYVDERALFRKDVIVVGNLFPHHLVLELFQQ